MAAKLRRLSDGFGQMFILGDLGGMRLAYYIACIAILLIGLSNCYDLTTCSAYASDIPTVEYFSLIANPALYDGREIRLHGFIYIIGETAQFFCSSCRRETRLLVEFNQTYQSSSNPKAIEAWDEMKRKSGFRRSSQHPSASSVDHQYGEVEFIGKFEASNPYKQMISSLGSLDMILENRKLFDFVFNVSYIESARPMPKDAKF
jgi:hypothetical protein